MHLKQRSYQIISVAEKLRSRFTLSIDLFIAELTKQGFAPWCVKWFEQNQPAILLLAGQRPLGLTNDLPSSSRVAKQQRHPGAGLGGELPAWLQAPQLRTGLLVAESQDRICVVADYRIQSANALLQAHLCHNAHRWRYAIAARACHCAAGGGSAAASFGAGLRSEEAHSRVFSPCRSVCMSGLSGR